MTHGARPLSLRMSIAGPAALLIAICAAGASFAQGVDPAGQRGRYFSARDAGSQSRYPAAQQRPQDRQQQAEQQPSRRPQARQQPRYQQAPPAQQQRRPYRVAERAAKPNKPSVTDHVGTGKPGEHPLMPALRWAYSGLKEMEKIRDYSAVLVKRERINGEVGDYERMFIKVRHDPFSVYLYFLSPQKFKGRECLYIRGANEGKMWAHDVGLRGKMFGTVSLKPDGVIAMQGQRYPLTEMGILNLTRRLVEVGEHDIKYGECEVKFYRGAKVADRQCTCIEVIHPVPRRNFRFHLARIFVDDELNVPIRYEAYSWPETQGGQPKLIEEYTYLNLKINPGFTDADFDIENPNYSF